MYYHFDFNQDSSFFETSKTIHFMKSQLDDNKHLKKLNLDIKNVSIKLWAESIIKHNLDINMTRVDHLNLLSEQNSEQVLNMIGKIIFKSKDERTDDEFKILREQGMVSNYFQLITLSVKEDVCNDLKQEFVDFQNLKLNNSSNPKLK